MCIGLLLQWIFHNPKNIMSQARIEQPATIRQHLSKPANWPVAFGLGLLWCISKVPFPINIRIGKLLGKGLYAIPSSRKHVTMVNIAKCFPALNQEQRQAFCKEVFENYGAGLVETAIGWWGPMGSMYDKVEMEGFEIFEQAMAKNRGVLLLGAHFSTLDLGAALLKKYLTCSSVYRPQKNQLFNAVILKGRQQHTANNFKNTELRAIIRNMRNGGVIWYAPDQDMGEKNSVYGKFFGQTAATISATAKLARVTGAPVLMIGQYRNKDDSGYQLKITGPIEGFPSDNEVADANAVNSIIENAISLAPTQYYWFHRRFKSQPGLSKAAIYKDEE